MADDKQTQPPRLLRCKDGFLDPKSRQVVKNGQLVRADHQIVAGRERCFEPAETGIEMATRAPGEIRIGARRPDAVVAQADRPSKPARGSRK